MKIIDVLLVAANSAFYFDDQQAIKDGARQNGFIYTCKPKTHGFHSIRQAGEAISIMLVLQDNSTAMGDCVAVQYSGAGGRDPLFTTEQFIPFIEQHIKPRLLQLDVSSFRNNAEFFDQLIINGEPLHTAIRYGLSQALLDATAIANHCLKAEVICKEYNLPISAEPVAIFGQSGDDRYSGADKMILKQVDALPHGLINNVESKLGNNGELLLEYVEWLRGRIIDTRGHDNYRPDIHIDVYGTIGTIFNHDYQRIAQYIAQLQEMAKPFQLYIEGPIDQGDRQKQITGLKAICEQLTILNSPAKIVADEWCNTYQDIIDFADADCCHMLQIKTPDLGSVHNTVKAVLYCKQKGIEAYQGGTCNETDISAHTCVHLALATRPERMLAKPGMGFDEGLMIVKNEMQRSIAQLKRVVADNQIESVA
ncbi:MAG: methylaspartate ammonia-lyase [Kangiellaceae bacterium]|jgi:methylaspartate ammonia-lyase|nr:methylaspartate ammonia-lyase [Kangiellaceae bacterium]